MDQAEKELGILTDAVVRRFSIDVSEGDNIFNLPPGTLGILRVTWKGQALEGLSLRDFSTVQGIHPGVSPRRGTPRYYIRHNQGELLMLIHPDAGESLSAPADDTELHKQSVLKEHLVVTAYTTPDPEDETYRLRSYMRRTACKYYALWKAYEREGPDQIVAVADFYKSRWEYFSSMYQMLISATRKASRGMQGDRSLAGRRRGQMPSTGAWRL